jgi:hypothetical protein
MSKLVYILFSLVGGMSLQAQLDRATVTGVVTDPTGAVISQVQITVRNTATNASYPSSTNGSRQYTVPNLPIGPYVLTFEATGLKKMVREGVE